MRRRITVGLTAKLAERLDSEATESGLTISDIVKTALAEYLERRMAAYGK